ncbi:MAG: hypothetical protein ACLU8B_03205 [Lachnospiraceae bacterium]
MKREYDSWIEQLCEAMESKETMTDDEIADVLARTLDDRRQLLKIMSMNHYDLEENSRMELLVEFKVSYGNAMKLAGVDYTYSSLYNLTFVAVRRMLRN